LNLCRTTTPVSIQGWSTSSVLSVEPVSYLRAQEHSVSGERARARRERVGAQVEAVDAVGAVLRAGARVSSLLAA